MIWMTFIAIFLILLLVIATWSTGSSTGGNEFPYKKIPTLFSAAERSFLGVLQQAANDNYYILGKVRCGTTESAETHAGMGQRIRIITNSELG